MGWVSRSYCYVVEAEIIAADGKSDEIKFSVVELLKLSGDVS
jgi:hypothetical protein